jgi:hypothetical protein
MNKTPQDLQKRQRPELFSAACSRGPPETGFELGGAGRTGHRLLSEIREFRLAHANQLPSPLCQSKTCANSSV